MGIFPRNETKGGNTMRDKRTVIRRVRNIPGSGFQAQFPPEYLSVAGTYTNSIEEAKIFESKRCANKWVHKLAPADFNDLLCSGRVCLVYASDLGV